MQYTLWKFFGLQRSGNHAILNWLIGLDPENTLFFNMVRPGEDLLERPSGISLPQGTRAYATRVDGQRIIQREHLEWFENYGGRLLLSYENYPIENFSPSQLDGPVFERFGKAVEKKNLLVVRNPFNMLPSAEKMLRRIMVHKHKDEKWLIAVLNRRLVMWKNYAFLHLNPVSITKGEFFTFLFDRWVKEKNYRDVMAERLGYVNYDQFLDFVSDAGKGSSFSGDRLENRGDVLNRWDDEASLTSELIEKHTEVIDYTSIIFGEEAVPPHFRSFVT